MIVLYDDCGSVWWCCLQARCSCGSDRGFRMVVRRKTTAAKGGHVESILVHKHSGSLRGLPYAF